jgi:hypothetical protein
MIRCAAKPLQTAAELTAESTRVMTRPSSRAETLLLANGLSEASDAVPSEFIQQQIDRLLAEAAEAIGRPTGLPFTRKRATPFDLIGKTAMRSLARFIAPGPAPAVPATFANGRYRGKKFLGEGGKKRVYLADDTLLDRDVAFALIKTDGLDDAGRDRITREAQAMCRLGAHPHVVLVFDLGEEPGLTPHPVPLPQGERETSPPSVGARFRR